MTARKKRRRGTVDDSEVFALLIVVRVDQDEVVDRGDADLESVELDGDSEDLADVEEVVGVVDAAVRVEEKGETLCGSGEDVWIEILVSGIREVGTRNDDVRGC